MTIAARIAARFTLDKNWQDLPVRTAPARGAWPDNPQFIAGGVFTDEGGRRYAVELRHFGSGRIETRVWLAGREMPEAHRGDIRQTAIDAYCRAFGCRPVVRLGREGTVYRHNVGPSRAAQNGLPFQPAEF